MGLSGLKSRQSCIPSPGDNPFPCRFHLLEIAGIPWLMACFYIQSQQSALSSQLFSDFLPHSFIYKDPCEYIKPWQIIHNHLLISRTLPYSHLQNPFCLRFHTHRLWGLQCTHRVGVRGHYSATHNVHNPGLLDYRLLLYKGKLHIFILICDEIYRVCLSKYRYY